MRAIITGASGFIASHLCHYLLQNNWEILAVLRPSSSLENIKDIQDRIQIYRVEESYNTLFTCMKDFHPDVVFHLGALFISNHSPDQIDSLIDSNIKFGIRILEAMKYAGIKYIINTGTSWQNYLYDSSQFDPVNLYSATKEAFEKILLFYGRVEGIKYITLRLFDTYGENDHRPKLINSLVKLAQNQTSLKMSAGEQQLNLVHVLDVCRAFLQAYTLLSENKIKSEQIFGVYGDYSISLKDLISLFEQLSKTHLNIQWGARPYRKREVMIPQQTYSRLPGWEAQILLPDGLKKIIAHSSQK